MREHDRKKISVLSRGLHLSRTRTISPLSRLYFSKQNELKPESTIAFSVNIATLVSWTALFSFFCFCQLKVNTFLAITLAIAASFSVSKCSKHLFVEKEINSFGLKCLLFKAGHCFIVMQIDSDKNWGINPQFYLQVFHLCFSRQSMTMSSGESSFSADSGAVFLILLVKPSLCHFSRHSWNFSCEN